MRSFSDLTDVWATFSSDKRDLISLVKEDKGKNSFFPGDLSEKSQVLLECEENKQDNWAAIALSCRQKSTKYLEKTTAILHWREKTTCFFVIIVYFLLFLSRTSEKCDHECLAEAKNFFSSET